MQKRSAKIYQSVIKGTLGQWRVVYMVGFEIADTDTYHTLSEALTHIEMWLLG